MKTTKFNYITGPELAGKLKANRNTLLNFRMRGQLRGRKLKGGGNTVFYHVADIPRLRGLLKTARARNGSQPAMA